MAETVKSPSRRRNSKCLDSHASRSTTRWRSSPALLAAWDAAPPSRWPAAGADIALGLRDGDTGADLADEIQALGRRAVRLQMDVTDLAQVGAAVDRAICRARAHRHPRQQRRARPENPAELVTEADFDLTCAVNLKGTFFVSQAVGKTMIARGSGRIINLSSQAGFVALPGESIYCMTKAAIAHLTKCLAVEWGPHGITVNAVAPTFILTPGTAPALENAAFKADVIERIAALHRVGEPMDVAGAIVFLASPAASLITGQTLLIDGGWTAR
jgi:NAD(P)-dependent dehydrogenase (short-subunit alcohol dehydrogenase family)